MWWWDHECDDGSNDNNGNGVDLVVMMVLLA
jgi:hypothetical protein